MKLFSLPLELDGSRRVGAGVRRRLLTYPGRRGRGLAQAQLVRGGPGARPQIGTKRRSDVGEMAPITTPQSGSGAAGLGDGCLPYSVPWQGRPAWLRGGKPRREAGLVPSGRRILDDLVLIPREAYARGRVRLGCAIGPHGSTCCQDVARERLRRRRRGSIWVVDFSGGEVAGR